MTLLLQNIWNHIILSFLDSVAYGIQRYFQIELTKKSVERIEWNAKKKKTQNKKNRKKKVQRTVNNHEVKVEELNSTISLNTLNINELNSLIKRQGLSHWIAKQDSTICYS